MMKFFQIGKYEQAIKLQDSIIVDVSCTCKWGTIHRTAWKDGEKLCRHIKDAIAELQNEQNKRKTKTSK